MTTYRYQIPPQSKVLYVVAVLSLLLSINTGYLLIYMPSYTQYYDYWVTLGAGLLLCIACLFLARRRNGFLLVPTGIFAVLACLTPSTVHWTEIILFVLLLLTMLLRLPRWVRPLFCLAGTAAAGVGIYAVIAPALERIERLAETGRATTSYVVPYLIRTLAGDVLCLLSMLLLLYAMRPHIVPGWMDEDDDYDRIWE